MSAPIRSLPDSPNLEHLRKQARDLQRDHMNGRAEAFRRLRVNLPKLSGATVADIAAAVVTRTDAQLVVAREYGFPSWPRLVEAVSAPSSEQTARLKAAIEAGAADTLLKLMEE